MEENLELNYLTTSDIYKLQDVTDTQIMIGGTIDESALSEAVRILIERARL